MVVDGEAYDAVVIAAHADQALAMLADPTDAEREILGAIPYQANRATLHTDASVMPLAAAPGRAGTSTWVTTGRPP